MVSLGFVWVYVWEWISVSTETSLYPCIFSLKWSNFSDYSLIPLRVIFQSCKKPCHLVFKTYFYPIFAILYAAPILLIYKYFRGFSFSTSRANTFTLLLGKKMQYTSLILARTILFTILSVMIPASFLFDWISLSVWVLWWDFYTKSKASKTES